MSLRTILIFIFALSASLAAEPLRAQEAPAKRLANVVGVAVDEYAKGVDARGKIFAPLEYEEAVAFLADAKEIAGRVADARSAPLAELIDEMRTAVAAKVAPSELNKIHERLVVLLGPDAELDLPTTSVDLAQGRRIYETRCASCHGETGQGDGFAAKGMAPAPPALADAELMADVTPALMYRITSVGIQGTAMPGFSDLSAAERWAVVTYVSTLRGGSAAARGAQLLAERCVSCASGAVPEGHTFGWLAERHDRQLLAAIAASDAALGLDATRPTSAEDAIAIVAALRAAPRVTGPRTRDANQVAAEVLRTLDASLDRVRAGERVAAGDLAFDAYVAFEPLESAVRTRDPGLVALVERHFADFKGAVQSLDLAAATSARERIAVGIPQVIELSRRETSAWGSFFESLLIIVREGFEAILILGAVIAFLIRTGNGARVREVRLGAIAGLAASAALAVVLRTVLVSVPASREIIEGATMLIAVAVLFSVSYWLLTKVETARWQLFIREKVGAALSSGGTNALAFVAFLAVFREGAETALFYQALLVRGPQVVVPVIAGMVVGSLLLVGIWFGFHRFGLKLPLRAFFASTSALLYALAFVFLGKGLRELQEGNVLSITPWSGGPYFEPLGIFPSVETLAAQGVLVALALFALWRSFLSPPREGPPGATVPRVVEPSSTPSARVEADAEAHG